MVQLPELIRQAISVDWDYLSREFLHEIFKHKLDIFLGIGDRLLQILQLRLIKLDLTERELEYFLFIDQIFLVSIKLAQSSF